MTDPTQFSREDIEPVLADLNGIADRTLVANLTEVIDGLVDEIRELREVVDSCVYDGWFPSYTGGAGWEWYAAVSSLPTDIPLTDEQIAVVERAGPT